MEWTKISLSVVAALFLCTSLACGTPWSDWSECSQTCGYGVQMRHRPCPWGDHAECIVSELGELKRCKLRECPIDGGYSSWSKWRRCSKTCGEGGVRIRFRSCTKPRPQYGGLDCQGSQRMSIPCSSLPPCPVDGGWSDWTEWGDCKAKLCRKPGKRFRTRKCNHPTPLHGGRPCEGGRSESEKCKKAGCKVHGGWSEWSDSTACSQTCGWSTRNQTRTCNNPVPAQGGRNCAGKSFQIIRCRGLDRCPRDEWSSESESSSVSGVSQVSQVTPEVTERVTLVEESQSSSSLSSVPEVEPSPVNSTGWNSEEDPWSDWSDFATTVDPDSSSSFESVHGASENNVEPSQQVEGGEPEEEPTDPPPNPETPGPESGSVECIGPSDSSASSYC